jgi:DNA invertase Pin-like site-specific DNA recombinase
MRLHLRIDRKSSLPNRSIAERVRVARLRFVNAALYIRVSKQDQNVENQLPVLRRIAEQRGLVIVAEHVEHMSGSKRARPGLSRLLQGAHEGEYRVVLVWALDRLGRTMAGVVETIQTLDRLGCTLVSHQEPWLVMEGPVRSLLVAIFAWVAEQERVRLIERTHMGIATARRNGKALGRPKVVLDVDAVFRMRKAGMSIAAIAKKLGCGVGTVHRAIATAA